MEKQKRKKRRSVSKDDFPLTKRMFSRQLFVVLDRLPDSVVASLTKPVRSRGENEEKCASSISKKVSNDSVGDTVESEEICASSIITKVSNDSVGDTVESEEICASSINTKVSNDSIGDTVESEEICASFINTKVSNDSVGDTVESEETCASSINTKVSNDSIGDTVESEEICASSINTKVSNDSIGDTVESEEICASSIITEVSGDDENSAVDTVENEDTDEIAENEEVDKLDENCDSSVFITEELDIKEEYLDDDDFCYEPIENSTFVSMYAYNSEQPTRIRIVNSTITSNSSEQPEENVVLKVTQEELEFLEQQLGFLDKIEPSISIQTKNSIYVNELGKLEPTVKIESACSQDSTQILFELTEKIQIGQAACSNEPTVQKSNLASYEVEQGSKQADTVYEKIAASNCECGMCEAFIKNFIPSSLPIPCFRCHKYVDIASYSHHMLEIHDVTDSKEIPNFCKFMKQDTIHCYECYFCGALNIGLTKLREHVRDHHRYCNICELVIQACLLANHSNLHSNFNRILTCSTPTCQVEFSSESAIFNHYMHPTHTITDRVVLNTPKLHGAFQCPYCFYSTSCMKVLTFHLRFHIRRRCPICFRNYIPTLRHVAKHTPNQKCGMCSGWGEATPKDDKNLCESEFDEIKLEMMALKRYRNIDCSPTEKVYIDLRDSQNQSSLQEIMDLCEQLPENCTDNQEDTEVPAMCLEVLAQQSASTVSNWSFANQATASVSNWPSANQATANVSNWPSANQATASVSNWPSANQATASVSNWPSANQATASVSNWPSANQATASVSNWPSANQATANVSNWPSANQATANVSNWSFANQATASVSNWPSANQATANVSNWPSANQATANVSNWPSANQATANVSNWSFANQATASVSNWPSANQASANTVTGHHPSTSSSTANPIATSSKMEPKLQKFANCTVQRKVNISVAKSSNIRSNSSVQRVDLCPEPHKIIARSQLSTANASKQPLKLGEKLLELQKLNQGNSQQANSSIQLLKLGDKLLKLQKINSTVQGTSTVKSSNVQANSSKGIVPSSKVAPGMYVTLQHAPQLGGPTETNSKLQSNSSKQVPKLSKVQNVPRKIGNSSASNSKQLVKSSKKTVEVNKTVPELQRNYTVQRIVSPSTTSCSKEQSNSSKDLYVEVKSEKLQKDSNVGQNSIQNKASVSTASNSNISSTESLELSKTIKKVGQNSLQNKPSGSTASNSNISLTESLESNETISKTQKVSHNSKAKSLKSSRDPEKTTESSLTKTVPETCDDASNSSIEILDSSETDPAMGYCLFCYLRHSEFGRCYTSILLQQEQSIRKCNEKKPSLAQFLNKHQQFRRFIHQRESVKALTATSYAGYRAMFYELYESDGSWYKSINCYKCTKKMPLFSLYDHLIDDHLMDETCLVEIKNYVNKLKQAPAGYYRCLLCDKTTLRGLKKLTEHVGTHLCRICRCKTKDSVSSQQHIFKHESEFKNIYYCHICKLEFNMEDAFQSHIKHFHRIFMLQSQHVRRTPAHVCPYCHFYSDSFKVVEFHLSQHNIATCTSCNSIHIPNAKHVYNSNHKMCMKCENIKGLEKVEHPPPPLKNALPCLFCTNLFRDELELFSHMVNTHMVCLLCKFLCKSVESYNHHMVTAHGTLHYRCDTCQKVIANKSRLLVHCKDLHPAMKDMDFTEVVYYTTSFEVNKQCPYCLKQFRRPAQLNKHLTVAHNVLQCADCSMFYFVRTGCMNCKRNSKDAIIDVVDL